MASSAPIEFDPRNPFRQSIDRASKRKHAGMEYMLEQIMAVTHQQSTGGWIGVDLDGTLAEYDHWRGSRHIGAPITKMVNRIRQWIAAGRRVRIFTARVAEADFDPGVIHEWLAGCGLPPLPVTNIKDMHMIQLWDDRAIQVIKNTGNRADGRE